MHFIRIRFAEICHKLAEFVVADVSGVDVAEGLSVFARVSVVEKPIRHLDRFAALKDSIFRNENDPGFRQLFVWETGFKIVPVDSGEMVTRAFGGRAATVALNLDVKEGAVFVLCQDV